MASFRSLLAASLLAWAMPLAALAAAPEPVAAAAAPVAHALDRADVEAWLDGFMPYALERGDVARGGPQVRVAGGQEGDEPGAL